MLVRVLRHLGYSVTYVRNFTDIDDKIIARAREAGEDPLALAQRCNPMHTVARACCPRLPPVRKWVCVSGSSSWYCRASWELSGHGRGGVTCYIQRLQHHYSIVYTLCASTLLQCTHTLHVSHSRQAPGQSCRLTTCSRASIES